MTESSETTPLGYHYFRERLQDFACIGDSGHHHTSELLIQFLKLREVRDSFLRDQGSTSIDRAR